MSISRRSLAPSRLRRLLRPILGGQEDQEGHHGDQGVWDMFRSKLKRRRQSLVEVGRRDDRDVVEGEGVQDSSLQFAPLSLAHLTLVNGDVDGVPRM